MAAFCQIFLIINENTLQFTDRNTNRHPGGDASRDTDITQTYTQTDAEVYRQIDTQTQR